MMGGLAQETHDRAWSLTSGARSTWPSAFLLSRHSCSAPLVRSLLSFFPTHHSHRTQETDPEPTGTQFPSVTAGSPLIQVAIKTKLPRHRRNPKSDAPHYSRHSKPVGSAWSRWESAARRSSPAHPRSWQAPVSRPSPKARGALATVHTT
jgi:hypothetical protein